MAWRSVLGGRWRLVALWFFLVLLTPVLDKTAIAKTLSLPTAQGAEFNAHPVRGFPTAVLLSPFGGSHLAATDHQGIPLSSGLLGSYLPRIPNLELGFLWTVGNNIRSGRFSADYLLPINLGTDSVVFGETHAEFQDFWKTPPGGTNNRVDLSFGGGARTILRNSTVVGINGFYDASRLFGDWFSSGGFGLEFAAITTGDGAIDLNVNWYGNLFTRDGLINAFRNKGGSYDLEAGYSQALWHRALDLRLKLTGYQFDIGTNVYGWRTGAELTTKDGVFSVKYEHGSDRVNGAYDTIGGFVNVGLQLENILRGENPFVSPEPVFQSPRNLRRMLTQKVKRDWHQPTAIVVTRRGQGGGGNLDRILASVTMAGGPAFISVPAFVPFPAVPHTSLDPTKHIVVEFDYAFDVAPAGGIANWQIEVVPIAGAFNQFLGVVATPPSGHLTFTLNTGGFPASDQSAFTSTATDPSFVRLQALAAGTTTLTITNVVIHFNQ